MESEIRIDSAATASAEAWRLADARLSINSIKFDRINQVCTLDLSILCTQSQSFFSICSKKKALQHWQLTVHNVKNVEMDDWDEPLEFVNREKNTICLAR